MQDKMFSVVCKIERTLNVFFRADVRSTEASTARQTSEPTTIPDTFPATTAPGSVTYFNKKPSYR